MIFINQNKHPQNVIPLKNYTSKEAKEKKKIQIIIII